MTDKPSSPKRNISFEINFSNEVQQVADSATRSPAKQLEHSFRIAQAVEKFLTASEINELKKGNLVSLTPLFKHE